MALVTLMPFALQYSISTLLYPVAVSQISFRFFASLMVDSFNGALLAMIMSASATLSAISSGLVVS